MTGEEILRLVEAAVLAYFIAINGGYILLNLLSIPGIWNYVQRWKGEARPWVHTGYEPPISLVVPAYNEGATIATSVRSLLQLEYPEVEIIVVNDGSTDRTLEVLVEEFALVPFPEAPRHRIPTRPVRRVYRSRTIPNLKVVDKENGRKADAVNAGLNIARCPLVLVMDGDSFLQRDSLLRVVQPFLEDPQVVACGGTVRIANGCRATEGFLSEVRLPGSAIAGFQVVEYLRAFLFGRMGWAPMNALLIISGAFGLFHRETLLAAGGFDPASLGEDMEVTVRIHRHLLLEKPRPYRVTFLPDPVCWTEVPEGLGPLRSQRVRWQRGLSEVLWAHRRLLFRPGAGAVGWLAFPFFLLFEWASPLVEVFGYLFIATGLVLGFVTPGTLLLFLGAAVGLGILLSTSALLLEEFSFHVYPRKRDVLALVGLGILENLGYRQLVAVWRLDGLFRWITGRKATWGAMPRSASWTKR